MIKIPLTLVRIMVFSLPMGLVTSCGSGSEAVQGTTIFINPPAVGVPVTESLGNFLDHRTRLYDVELRAPSGNAQISTLVTLRTEGVLYEVDKSTVPFTYTPRPTPYLASISNNGVYTVAIDFTIPAAFSGEITVLEASSGTAYGRTNAVVTCTDSNPAVPPVCP